MNFYFDEDYENLRKILQKAESKGFDKLICLGDISGFSMPYYKYEKTRNASACLSLLREKCEIITPGNHDLHAAGIDPKLPEVLEGQETWQHELDLESGYSEEEINFLAGLPYYKIFPVPSGNILFSHYVYPNLTGFVKGLYSWEVEFKAHFEFMKEKDCYISFTGHAHPGGFYKVDSRDFKHYRKRSIKIISFPSLIGIPPATRNQHQSSFCIFDTFINKLEVFK